ncbi:hypothetical protein PENSPDRAFT_580766 [Peniophora sp. CONT]|nr:hypothetical protein PENSPDRAFT_580766 [Peniophora sp. CONT]
MPFYELVCIAAHNRDYRHIKELVRRSALHVMDGGGVVRGFRYWGLKTLPQKTHKQKAIHTHGDYWTMHFDASPDNQRGLHRLLRKDPSVVRASMLKMGENLRGVSSGPEHTIMPTNIVPTLGTKPNI